MAVTKSFTPAAIDSGLYNLAQTPVLGGEVQVWLSTGASRLLGTAMVTSTDGSVTVSWRQNLLPTIGTPGPIAAVAAGGGIVQSAADTITYAGLTGSFTPCGWTANQTFGFPTGRAVELTGTYSAPTVSSVPTFSLTAGTGIQTGSWIDFIELPALSTFVLAGQTTDRRVTVPSRNTKAIAAGMYEAFWTTPGIIKTGNLAVTGLNQGYDEGLLRFAGVKCQAMLVPMREGRTITARSVCLDWTGSAETPYGSGESESTVSLTGMFNRMCSFVAP
jgi:hypothetical protein